MIKKAEKSEVPALDCGLDVLEMTITAGRELSFSELLENLSVSRASAARILKVLKERGYLSKNPVTGKYSPGLNLSTIGPNTKKLDLLNLVSTKIMETLSKSIGNSTVILFYKTLNQLLAVNKIQPENAETMIALGKTVDDLERNPWGWLCYHYADAAQQKKIYDDIADKKLFKKQLIKRIKFYEKYGYTYDNCEIHKIRRRLAAPVFLKNKLVAVLGTGGSILEFTNDKIEDIGRKLVKHANLLSNEL